MRKEVKDARDLVQKAIELTGLDSTNLAKAANCSASTLTRLMGDNPKSAPTHRTIVRLCDAVHMMTGQSLYSLSNTPSIDNQNILEIPEYDVFASAGHGSFDDNELISQRWQLPKDFIKVYVSNPRNLAIITVDGESMEPDYHSGEKVLVDTGRGFSNDSVYLISTRDTGLMVKQVQALLAHEPPAYKVISKNRAYPSQDVPASKLKFHARVIAKWTWK